LLGALFTVSSMRIKISLDACKKGIGNVTRFARKIGAAVNMPPTATVHALHII